MSDQDKTVAARLAEAFEETQRAKEPLLPPPPEAKRREERARDRELRRAVEGICQEIHERGDQRVASLEAQVAQLVAAVEELQSRIEALQTGRGSRRRLLG